MLHVITHKDINEKLFAYIISPTLASSPNLHDCDSNYCVLLIQTIFPNEEIKYTFLLPTSTIFNFFILLYIAIHTYIQGIPKVPDRSNIS